MSDLNFIMRAVTGRIVESIDLGTGTSGISISQTFSLESAHLDPVVFLGFYLKPTDPESYLGLQTPEEDYSLLLKWADLYTPAEGSSPGLPGIEISQYDWEAESIQTRQIRGGYGDSEANPLVFTGNERRVVNPDDRITFTIALNIPDQDKRQISEALKLHANIVLAGRVL